MAFFLHDGGSHVKKMAFFLHDGGSHVKKWRFFYMRREGDNEERADCLGTKSAAGGNG